MPSSAHSPEQLIPLRPTLNALRDAVESCRGCDLYRRATQAVFGEGRATSAIVFIGEQPGSEEDLAGRPFVGPAGKLFDRALEDAGIDREATYVTNTVKHFKFEERGKRRLHKRPNAQEIHACVPWLEAEIQVIKPVVIACLGATASQALFGSAYRLTRERGKFVKHAWAPHATSTIHPSAILRVLDADERRAEYSRFVADLELIKRVAESRGN